MRWGLLVVLPLLAGCTDVASLAADLDRRQVQSCITIVGGYGPFAGVRVVTATGGATVEQCMTH